jgi:signal transduction histidine kinase
VISLRIRVALASAGVVIALLGSGSWVISLRIADALAREFDLLTIQRLNATATGIEFEHGGIEVHGQGPEVATIAIVTAAGVRLQGEDWMQPPRSLARGNPAVLASVTDDAGQTYRTAWCRLLPENDEEPATTELDIGIAMSMGELQEQQKTIRSTLLAGSCIIACAVIAVLTLTLGRMLAPHARLAEQVGELDPRQPGRRLEVAHLPPELRSIAERINDLCTRLERAYGLASSIHAAAAHELRTPLAGLRATIEVATQPGVDAHAALATCHTIALQMQARIDNLLMAARIDAGQLVPRRDEVDVHAMLRQAWQQVEDRARSHGLDVIWNLTGSGLAIADPEALRMVLANLCDNAVSHANGPQPVTITCTDAGSRLVLTCANPAAGMAAATVSQIFDRGWRSGSASPDRRHAGLGMGISRDLVGLMAGRIEARLVAGVFCVDVTLPAPGVFEYW